MEMDAQPKTVLTVCNKAAKPNEGIKIDQLQSPIDFCEQRINEIVYELYGLTKDEIKVIETNLIYATNYRMCPQF